MQGNSFGSDTIKSVLAEVYEKEGEAVFNSFIEEIKEGGTDKSIKICDPCGELYIDPLQGDEIRECFDCMLGRTEH